MQSRGRLEEALALHKAQEAICLELVSNAGLAYCYWYWDLLERSRGDSQGEHATVSAAPALFEGLAMPRVRRRPGRTRQGAAHRQSS